jgi:hypothetical protein
LRKIPMLIQIQETHAAAPGKVMARIVAAGGQTFYVRPEMLANMKIGSRYQVETKDNVFNGRTYCNIIKATFQPENGDSTVAARAAARTAAPAQENGFGAVGNSGWERQSFVQGVLQALIRAGQVGNDKTHLYRTTTLLMQLYDHTLGGGANGGASGAGHRNGAGE